MQKILLTLMFIGSSIQHQCQTDHKMQKQQIIKTKSTLDSDQLKATLGDWVTLKPFFDLTYLEDKMTDQRVQLMVNRLIPLATQYFRRTLKVRDERVIIPKKNSCYYTDIPEKYVNKDNIDGNIYVVVTLDEQSTDAVAWAIPCAVSELTERPIISQLNFNLQSISLRNEDFQAQIETTIHEMVHALGFHRVLYDTYKDKNGEYYKQPTTTYNRNGVQRLALSTPKVIEMGAKHFRCSSIKGVELENDGGVGTKGSHWERTIVYNEMMTGSDMKIKTVLSVLTLAALEDSSWYQVDYTRGDTFTFGAAQGCQFLQDTCTTQEFDAYCYDYYSKSCSGQRKVYCGNSDGLMSTDDSFCNVAVPIEYCRQPLNPQDQKGVFQSETVMGEQRGDDSYCFASDAQNKSYDLDTNYNDYFDMRCHKVVCDPNTNIYQLQIGNNLYKCESENMIRLSDDFFGTVQCKKYEDVCQQKQHLYCLNGCSGNGYCLKGQCECLNGFSGDLCQNAN